jgi:RNA binding exosome subunit
MKNYYFLEITNLNVSAFKATLKEMKERIEDRCGRKIRLNKDHLVQNFDGSLYIFDTEKDFRKFCLQRTSKDHFGNKIYLLANKFNSKKKNFVYWLNGEMERDMFVDIGIDAESIIDASEYVKDELEAYEAYRDLTNEEISLEEFRENFLQEKLRRYIEDDAIALFKRRKENS